MEALGVSPKQTHKNPSGQLLLLMTQHHLPNMHVSCTHFLHARHGNENIALDQPNVDRSIAINQYRSNAGHS